MRRKSGGREPEDHLGPDGEHRRGILGVVGLSSVERESARHLRRANVLQNARAPLLVGCDRVGRDGQLSDTGIRRDERIEDDKAVDLRCECERCRLQGEVIRGSRGGRLPTGEITLDEAAVRRVAVDVIEVGHCGNTLSFLLDSLSPQWRKVLRFT